MLMYRVETKFLRNLSKTASSDGSSRHYHPLALKVLGQQLGPKSSMWAGQLYKIDTFSRSRDMNHPVVSILKTSFDSLKYEHQLIVVDVAVFSPCVIWRLECHSILDWLCMMHEESAEDMKHLLGNHFWRTWMVDSWILACTTYGVSLLLQKQ